MALNKYQNLNVSSLKVANTSHLSFKLYHFVCYVSLCILAALYHQLVGHQ